MQDVLKLLQKNAAPLTMIFICMAVLLVLLICVNVIININKRNRNKRINRINKDKQQAFSTLPSAIAVKNEEPVQSLLPKKLLLARHGWNEELEELCKREGIKSVFTVLQVYNELDEEIKKGYLALAFREKWMKQYISRLGTAMFDVETGLQLWRVAPDETVFAQTVDLLSSYDEEVRMCAVHFLSGMKDTRTIPYLVAALMQPQRYVAARVVEVLESFGNTAATVLSRLLPELSGQAQLTVLESLSVFPPNYPMTTILECLCAPRDQVRMFAARTLGDSLCFESVPMLIDCLTDTSWQVRAAAVKSLGKLKAQEAHAKIKELENDDSWCVRANCKEALAGLQEQTA